MLYLRNYRAVANTVSWLIALLRDWKASVDVSVDVSMDVSADVPYKHTAP